MNSVCDGEGDRPAAKKWDQPLTTADMRSRAADWSLADDSQLLAYLESFTQSLTARTAEVQKQLEAIVHETRVSGVKVSNVINDFNHLSSLQFVENRVYDEEVKEGTELKEAQGDTQSSANGLVSKEEQEAALLKRVSEAFRLGVEVIHTSLEVVDLRQEGDSEDDSEDEDEEGGGGGDRLRQVEPLLRPLDPYLARPLPALIGSEQFLNDDRVGLGELLSDEEEGEEEERSSRGEYESNKSETDSDLEEDTKKNPAAPVDNKMASYMRREFGGGDQAASDNEDMFGGGGRKDELLSASSSSSSSSERNSDEDEFTILRKNGRTTSSSKKRDSVSSASKRSSVSSAKKSDGGGKVRKTEDDLFGPATNDLGSNGMEAEEEESASPFARKSGLFSGGGKLFDDDDGGEDDEGDLFRDVSAAPRERPPSIPNPPAPNPPAANPPAPKLTQSGKRVPAGGVSMLGGSALPPLVSSKRKPSEVKEDEATAAAAARAPSLSSASDRLSTHSDDDEDLLFRGTKKETPSRTPASSTQKSAAATPSKAKVEDIFNDEDDDDSAFALPKTSLAARKPPVVATGLFGNDDDDDEDDDLWAPTPGRKTSKPENSVPPSQQPPPVAPSPRDPYREEPPPLPKAEDKPKPKTAGGLFDDDDDDFLFSAPSAVPKTESKPTKSFLFDDDEDIFASISSAKPSAGKTSSGVEDKPKLDLFGDGSALGGASTANRGRSASRGIFLFEDEAPEKTKPAVATAVTAAAEKQQQQQPEAVAHPEVEEQPVAVKRRATNEPISLFGANEEEDEEEDLFAERAPPTQLADSQSSHSVQSASWSTGSKGDTEPAPTGQSEPVVEEPVAKPRAGSRFLFDQEDDLFKSTEDGLDVDLFAAPAAKPAVAESSSPPKKKPAGGVSLFGGSSLFGDELKSRLGRPTTHSEHEEKLEPPDQEASGGDSFAPPPMPQIRPPLRDTKVETSVSFDEPADQIRTLTSATKDRAKVKAKRRPPTRRKRQAELKEGEEGEEEASGRESPPAADGSDLFAPSHPAHNDVAPAAAAAAATPAVVRPSPQPRTRLWFDDDATGGGHQSSDSEPTTTAAREKDRLAPPAPKAASMVKSPSTEEEDLFALDNSLQPIPEARRRPGQARTAGATRSQPPFGGSIFDDDVDDDLFADPAAERSVAPRRPSLHENSGHVSDDGIFGAADTVSHSSENSSSTKTASASPSTVATPTPTQETRKEVPPPQEAPKKTSGGIFDDDDDDADIFAPSTRSSSALTSRAKRSTLFEDDTDDIFSSKPVKSKVQSSEKKSSQQTTSSTAVKKALPKTTDFKDPLLGDLNE